jgi:hypothetical protein
LATTFAVLEAMSLVFSALGVLVVQLSIGLSGARAALVGTGCVLAGILAGTVRALRHVDDVADAPVVAIRLLRRIPLFAALPGPALEGVARAAYPVHVPAGTTIIAEGEAGDRYEAIARGTVEVSVRGQVIRTMHAGEGFGEIALLAHRPRTATVRAISDVDVLAIERDAFLTVVLGHDASARVAWSTATRFEPSIDERIASGGAGAASEPGMIVECSSFGAGSSTGSARPASCSSRLPPGRGSRPLQNSSLRTGAPPSSGSGTGGSTPTS